MSRIADEVEAEQLTYGYTALTSVQGVVAARDADPQDLRLALTFVTDALGAALRIATSRGARLPAANYDEPADSNDGDEPDFESEAFR
ncbi:hypothetical protein [Streptomyces sp. H27-C3]|uniref:hypothetical protein n=1 Tax=Streptomyces sp. H27-C3 TaxID=3046305 RepID=UPI0024BB8196|nr:hypothetical protein [Streptomyces sp. H27-C3]MDJ0461493.1 hypothetical protein [Streptomyces sp. H27-C3]